MIEIYSVSRLIADSWQLNGSVVTAIGTLLADLDNAWLIDARERSVRVRLGGNELVNLLRGTTPMHIGRFTYNDTASVKAKFLYRREKPPTLEPLTINIIRADGAHVTSIAQ
ncbi:hypothetical protein ACQP2F_15510 [Actinoplanes sp. CA-030573]|uniref:hypothetical protein n=1 Tax=Actinoplanes sp. CA-030573 TaxID=3239898 RepID=UPI003D90F561